MKRHHVLRSAQVALGLALLGLLPAALAAQDESTGATTTSEATDPEGPRNEALERVRIEEALIQGERTVILLGRLLEMRRREIADQEGTE